ncbi:hypothetical protein JCM11251_001875 [Rhodosporidiobolus azoricus]
MASNSAAKTVAAKKGPAVPGRKVVRVVFLALLLDLLAFTMPLPLFPRLIEDFVRKEALDPSATPTFLSQTLYAVRSLRAYLFSFAPSSSQARLSEFPAQWDLTILGGLLAALFSFCQFFISPFLGRLSDRYGRKNVLLATMVGNLASAVLWLAADSFGLYAASRIVGGLSEGNVQLSIACITDVTSPATRSRSLALVGIAFAVAFTLGPSVGAYFSSRVIGHGSVITLPSILADLPGFPAHVKLNSYAVPAAITLVLLTLETIYLALCLPETRGWAKKVDEEPATIKNTAAVAPPSRTPAERVKRLRRLERVHFLFLFFFAGAEFTLTFLTHNFFSFSNLQNGRLLGFIGILSSLLQGGYVRRRASTPLRTASLAHSGVRTCAIALFLLAGLPHLASTGKEAGAKWALWSAAAGLAFVSATVVNSLNALASFETDPELSSTTTNAPTDPRLEKGAAIGRFRSRGQLGRALGPLVTTALYFTVSPTWAYGVCGVGMLGVVTAVAGVAREEREREKGEGKKVQ